MAEKRDYSEITPEIQALAAHCSEDCVIDKELYTKYKVNRGLRDLNGNGVLTGLTEISEIQAKTPDGESCDGSLFYRGYNVRDLVKGFLKDGRFGFEEIVYLLLFGNLPSAAELDSFRDVLDDYRSLPNSFVRDIIMKAPSTDIMNSMARSVLTLYSYDNRPNDTSIPNVLRQCLQLIATVPPAGALRLSGLRLLYSGQDQPFHPRPGARPVHCRKHPAYAPPRLQIHRDRKPGCWTWHWCSTQSTAAATTPPLPPMSSPPPAPTPTPPLRRRWAA